MSHPNPAAQKILDDLRDRADKAAAFADLVMKIMDSFVPSACKDEARKAMMRVASEFGLEIHQTRKPTS